MPWIESHTELRHHPKTKRLARLLDVSLAEAIGHLHMLWWWVMDYAPDGNLSGYSNDDLADAGGWEGDPNLFVGSLVDCRVRGTVGFLERDERGDLHVHDWQKYGGKLHEERERRAAHMKVTRQTREGHVRVTLPSQSDTDADARGSRDPLEDMTGEESTGQERTEEKSTHAASGGASAPRTRKPKATSVKADEPKADRKAAVFSAFVRNMHWDSGRLSSNDRGQVNYAIKALPDDATADEVDLAFARWPRVMHDCTVTPPAIAKHFSTLMADARRAGLVHDPPMNGKTNGTSGTPPGWKEQEAAAWRQPDGKVHPDAPDWIKTEYGPSWGLGDGDWKDVANGA